MTKWKRNQRSIRKTFKKYVKMSLTLGIEWTDQWRKLEKDPKIRNYETSFIKKYLFERKLKITRLTSA